MTHRRIVIGDVHGHYNALISLLDAIAPASDDQVYFLGDLIDRGPHSAKVVDLVLANKYKCLLGNHEQLLLDAVGNGQIVKNVFQAWLYSGGYATLVSYDNNIPQDHLDWMKTLPTYLDLGDIWLVHAGVHPQMPIETQTADHFCWIRDEFHSMTQPYFADKLIITGHTITFTFPGVKPGQLVSGAGWLDIDTGAYHPNSGWLTGLDITNNKVYQVNAKKGTRRTLPLEKVAVQVEPSVVLSKRAKSRL
ncbi:serine/threonine protein phosphatase [Hydrococcus rivularis NIES-593]|uniref:Serine/threonine protein phosphatase n=1 Tax=Hydrococcus rivularis NIES-593 TaxID=1921803 RepID=A0A1U7HAG7_9CYAN|nr:metallophosphoesterase family protein [Hydrococcus rivularis]OKH20592.1 serine/threonine protein phosphatase [Hydrococcus rivularis NIES-593]